MEANNCPEKKETFWDHVKSISTNRFINEGGRLIFDIVEMIDTFNMKGYLLTIDTEKAFDSVDHYFLLAILEKYGFKKPRPTITIILLSKMLLIC